MELPTYVRCDLAQTVGCALAEDIGTGDLTAQLVAKDQYAQARVISRESAVICGRPWVDEVFRQIDASTHIDWRVVEGDAVAPDTVLFMIDGPARALLSAERCALNFLQTLSATATQTRHFVDAIAGTSARISDTRKTLPGLRHAQKYAVLCGGGINHRIGLDDGILIKENHIAAAGGIAQAIRNARNLHSDVPLMTEAESLDEVRAALASEVDLLLVDDFSLDEIRQAVALVLDHRRQGGRTVLEYSGGASLATIRDIALTGVDRIAVGAITKHIQAIDLSMRFLEL